jgi:hypothetical protein
MSGTTAAITWIVGIVVGIAALAFVWWVFQLLLVKLPMAVNERVEGLKETGAQGEATIVRLPHLKPYSTRSAMYRRIEIGLAIRVPGVPEYEVDKVFNMPSGAIPYLEVGKVVSVWIDAAAPLDHSKIVIHVDFA